MSSITLPQSLEQLGDAKTSEDLEKILDGIEIRPRRGRLSPAEMLSLAPIFMQMQSWAESRKMGDVCLAASSDLYASLDSSLSDTPGWWVLQHRMQTAGKVEVYALAGFIEASQRKP